MVKKLFFCLAVFFLLVQIVSAIDTEIKIKTIPNHEVQLTVLESSSSSSVLESFRNNSDEYGDISFIYSSDKSKFGLIVFVKKDSDKVISKKYSNNFIVGEQVYEELAPDWFEFIETPISNETLEENETIKNITTNESELENQTIDEIASKEIKEETQSPIIGSAISGAKGFFSKKTIYYTLGIIVLLMGFLGMKIGINKLKSQKEIKIKKLSEMQTEKKEKIMDKKDIIEDAEKKIKEAQEDIKKIKSDDEIEKAKKKIIEDEKELIRLRNRKE